MPTLETLEGKPVDVTPVDAETVNAQMAAALADDAPAEQSLPKRTPKPAETDKPKARRGRPPKAEQSRTAPSGGGLSDDQRKTGVKGLVQLGAGLCLIAGKATGNQAWTADAVTIDSMSDEIAGACVDVAKADARFAAALDKICSAGPYGALVAVAVGVGAQCARNHKPALAIPGTRHPDELLASLEAGSGASGS